MAPDEPSELASMLTETFGPDVLDAADFAASGYVLLSEDLYYRQTAIAAVGSSARGVCLQSALAFARERKLISEERHAATVVRLAWRRHSHVSLDAETLFQTWETDPTADFANFAALAEFIGTRNAEMQSHLVVVTAFLDRLWRVPNAPSVRVMKATGILLDKLIRFQQADWATTLTLVADASDRRLREYVVAWTRGHFLDFEQLRRAEAHISAIRARAHILRVSR